jgi:hypothetical protein
MLDGAVTRSVSIIELLFKARGIYVPYSGTFDWKLFIRCSW